jgi:hypothetical protein
VQHESVLEIPAVISPENVTKAFNAIVSSLLGKVVRGLSEARTLAATRDI